MLLTLNLRLFQQVRCHTVSLDGGRGDFPPGPDSGHGTQAVPKLLSGNVRVVGFLPNDLDLCSGHRRS